MNSIEIIFLVTLQAVTTPSTTSHREQPCPRDRSRIVRKMVKDELQALYSSVGTFIPRTCPVHLERDMFGFQEDHKDNESPSKWVCHFCGKAFYEERFVDKHMVNRHGDTVRQGGDIECFADYCDIFRCDVVAGYKKPQYWDKALCKEDDLKTVNQKCHELMKQCVPIMDIKEESDKMLKLISEKVCGYLTCKNYWDLPESQLSPVSTAVYIIAAIILSIGLMVYYYIAYVHFYTDESIFDTWDTKNYNLARNPYMQMPQGQEIRHRGVPNTGYR